MLAVNTTLSAPGIAAIVDFSYVPFGNAYFNVAGCPKSSTYVHDDRMCWNAKCANATSAPVGCFSGDIVCQHGPDECLGNRIELCAQKYATGTATQPAWVQAGQFVVCFEGVGHSVASAGPGCAKQVGLDWSKINACATGSEGDALVTAAAKTTAALNPVHVFTPWFILDGTALGQNWSPLLPKICAAYQGSPKPAGCSSVAEVPPLLSY